MQLYIHIYIYIYTCMNETGLAMKILDPLKWFLEQIV